MLDKYRIFIEVAESKNMSETAKKMNYTVPGISYTIGKLEEEFGFPLLARNHSRIDLTPEGMELLSSIKNIVKMQDELERSLNGIANNMKNSIHIASISSMVIKWISSIIKEFTALEPSAKVILTTGEYDPIFEKLYNREVDLAINIAPEQDIFHFIPLIKDEFFVLLPENHHLAAYKSITPSDLKDERIIVPGYGKAHDPERFIIANHLEAGVVNGIMEEKAIIALVKVGFGIGLISKLSLETMAGAAGLAGIRTVSLKNKLYRTIGILTNDQIKLSPQSDMFLKYLQNWFIQREISGFY